MRNLSNDQEGKKYFEELQLTKEKIVTITNEKLSQQTKFEGEINSLQHQNGNIKKALDDKES